MTIFKGIENEAEYVYDRETTSAHIDLPIPRIVHCSDVSLAVFENSYDLFEYDLILPHVFDRCTIVSYGGGYENAFLLGRLQ